MVEIKPSAVEQADPDIRLSAKKEPRILVVVVMPVRKRFALRENKEIVL